MSENKSLEEQIAELQEVVSRQSRDIADLQRVLQMRESSAQETPAQTETLEETQREPQPSAQPQPQEEPFFFEEESEEESKEESKEEESIEEINMRRAYERLHRIEHSEPDGEKRDMEKKIGGMMGIVASVMIFISIILFVTMVYSSMNEIMKILCMFLFSGAILAAGVFMMNRNLNVFTMSLTGCGMGAVYLSLFITHIYFGRINQVVLYLLLAAWAVAVYYFFGKKYLAFKYTGQAGITISVIFGFFLIMSASMDAENIGRIWFLAGYFMAASWFYLFADRAGDGRGTAVCVLFDEVSMLAFYILMFWMKAGEIGNMPLYAVFMIANMLLFLWRYVATGGNKDNTLRGVWYVMLLIYTSVILYVTVRTCIMPYGSVASAFVAIPVMAALLVIEILRKKKDMLHVASVCVIYVLLLLFTGTILADEWIAVVFAAYAALVVWAGYHFEDRTAVVLSYVSIVLAAVLLDTGLLLALGAVVCVCAAVLGGVFLCRENKMYSSKLKIGFYAAVQVSCGLLVSALLFDIGADRQLSFAWRYVFCAGLSIVACQRFFCHSFVDRDESEADVSNAVSIINGILMMVGSSLLMENDNGVMKFVLLVVTAAVYMINVLPFFERFGDNKVVGFYNGLKMSLYVFIVLKSYELSGPIISIGWLVLAIILIVVGFGLEFKNLRVYGLGLTMFSLCKLLIVDIDYGSAELRAFSFLISGVLCFAINLIYHKMQKDE